MADKPTNDFNNGLQPLGRQTGETANPRPSVSIDWELYASYLEESDLSDEQKRDFIETLWSIVLAFVDLGFGIHPTQQALEKSMGQNEEICASIVPKMVSLKDQIQEK